MGCLCNRGLCTYQSQLASDCVSASVQGEAPHPHSLQLLEIGGVCLMVVETQNSVGWEGELQVVPLLVLVGRCVAVA